MATKGPLILLLGAAGQVGRELKTCLGQLGNVTPLTRRDCDLANPAAVRQLLDEIMPQVIVNAAAYTAVDKAETEPEMAARLNSTLPGLLASFAAEQSALLVDFSTDYVFDGHKEGPWCESDRTAPLSVYGSTKLAGLRAIEASGCDFLVLRVTWIYSRNGVNFPNTILRLAREREEIAVVTDQFGAPTPADWIAEVTSQCIDQVLVDRTKSGVYHLAPAGSTTWHDFAGKVVELALQRGATLKLSPRRINAVASSAYPAAARRPVNSVLDTTRLQKTFAIIPPHWLSLFEREGSLDI